MVLIRVFSELNVKKNKKQKNLSQNFKTVNRRKFNNEICQEWKSTSYHFTTETSTHLFCHCPSSIAFWKYFEASWSVVRDQQIHLTLEDIIVGVITRPFPLLNQARSWGFSVDGCSYWQQYFLRLQYTLRSTIFFKFRFFG